jgi:hypothetical protein
MTSLRLANERSISHRDTAHNLSDSTGPPILGREALRALVRWLGSHDDPDRSAGLADAAAGPASREQAQATIRLVFELFDRFRTIGKLMRYLVRAGNMG